jgi:hypothetical protein
VKILFDANTPAPLARFLRGHEVAPADELGWQGLENGALLDSAEQAGFDLLLTCDQLHHPTLGGFALLPCPMVFRSGIFYIDGKCHCQTSFFERSTKNIC